VISLRVQVRTFARLSLADIANPAAGVINYGFAELTGSSGLNKTHFVQGAPGRMVVGSLDSTSQLRIFTWLDSSNSITANTVGITQITQGANYTSVAPDGVDWLAVSFPGNITGAAYIFVPANPGGASSGHRLPSATCIRSRSMPDRTAPADLGHSCDCRP